MYHNDNSSLNEEVEDLLSTINAFYDLGGVEKEPEETEPDYSSYTPELLAGQGYADMQIDEIMLGVSQNLPVWYYAKDCYNWRQMREIRLGLLENLDTSLYDNVFFSAEQMHEIRLGLMDGLDVSSYASLIHSTGDMAAARKNLLSSAYKEHPEGHAKSVLDEESGVTIRLSDDSMEAFVSFSGDREVTFDELKQILHDNQIVFGVSRKWMKEALEQQKDGKEKKIAEGKTAVKGEDGRYEYFFDPLLPGEPQEQADGSVDYTEVVVADKKNVGDILAKYYPAGKGTDGETVTGVVIKGDYGVQLPSLRGQGIFYDKENHIYKAAESGYVVVDEDEHTLNVWNVYIVNGDVNRYTGHISYNGMIYIRGSVSDMAEIQASGNVVVDGYVEAAHIQAGENIILRGGMNGCGSGILEAKGKVVGKFFEAATIYAGGNVEGNYFLNCRIVTDRSVIAKGAKSRIMGGNIKAGYSVESYSLLDVGKSLTVIDVGDPVWLGNRLRQTQKQLAKVEDELRQLRDGKERIGGMIGDGASEKNTLFHRICTAIRMKEEEKEQLLLEQSYNEQINRRAKKAFIKAYGQIQSGVTLLIGGKTMRTEKNRKGTVIFKREEA